MNFRNILSMWCISRSGVSQCVEYLLSVPYPAKISNLEHPPPSTHTFSFLIFCNQPYISKGYQDYFVGLALPKLKHHLSV